MISAQYLHDSCQDAVSQCPHYDVLPYDLYIKDCRTSYGRIPEKGLYVTLDFWKVEGREILWELGYSDYLPNDVKEFFNKLDAAIVAFTKDFCT
jgi:hypothetical protein